MGESERQLRAIFEAAKMKAPSLIVIDELDAMVPARDRVQGEVEARVVATLLTLMDGIHAAPNVVVVGTTNRIDTIDPALRREGRFGTEVRIGAPDLRGRRQILAIHSRRMPLSGDVDLDSLAELTSGFVGADLAQLCQEAAYAALRDRAEGKDLLEVFQNDVSGLAIEHRHFSVALTTVRPSALREFLVEHPRDSWEEIVGFKMMSNSGLINFIIESVDLLPKLRQYDITPASGVSALHGPAGRRAKTMLARRAMAAHARAAFICVKTSDTSSGRNPRECGRFLQAVFLKAQETAAQLGPAQGH